MSKAIATVLVSTCTPNSIRAKRPCAKRPCVTSAISRQPSSKRIRFLSSSSSQQQSSFLDLFVTIYWLFFSSLKSSFSEPCSYNNSSYSCLNTLHSCFFTLLPFLATSTVPLFPFLFQHHHFLFLVLFHPGTTLHYC